MQAEQQNGLVTRSTVRYYSPHALAAWLHTLYTCHGWNNLVHVYLMFTPTNNNWCAHVY